MKTDGYTYVEQEGASMKLYERDYTIVLTGEEKEAYASIQTGKNNRGFPRFSHPNKEVRDFLWQIRSYFPNNYLHFRKYKDEIDFGIVAKMFAEVLSVSGAEIRNGLYCRLYVDWKKFRWL